MRTMLKARNHHTFFLTGQLIVRPQSLDLPNSGDIMTLRERHRQYAVLHNSNLDLARPRPKSDLLKDLAKWERSRLKGKNTVSKSHAVRDFSGLSVERRLAINGGSLVRLCRRFRQTH
jgi:hypothetical protein